MEKQLAGILLAAGDSSRFKRHKLIQPLNDGTPIALRAALNLLSSLPQSVAIIRKDDHRLKHLLTPTGIQIIENPAAENGISTSIACGIRHYDNANGWIIALGDMPFIPIELINKIVEAVKTGATIAAPRFENQRGHPVGFSSCIKDELLLLQGDIGAKRLIEKYNNVTQYIDVIDCGVLKDIDKPSDL